MKSDRCSLESCRHVACCGVTADGRRIVAATDSERCKAGVLYGDKQCAMTRESYSNYCAHHAVTAIDELDRLAAQAGEGGSIMPYWIVDTRDRVLQRVTPDCPAPTSDGGRFWKVEAATAKEAVALARHELDRLAKGGSQ